MLASAALGADHHEATQGDLSNNRFAPTTVNLAVGLNHVSGTFGMSFVPNVVTFWINETDGGEAYPYALSFKVQATPPVAVPAITPWSAAIATLALLGVGTFHLRRRAVVHRLQSA